MIEMAGLAPVPFCGMILADFGAQVPASFCDARARSFLCNRHSVLSVHEMSHVHGSCYFDRSNVQQRIQNLVGRGNNTPKGKQHPL